MALIIVCHQWKIARKLIGTPHYEYIQRNIVYAMPQFYQGHYSIAILESTMVLALQNIHLYVHQLAVICAVVACSVLAGCSV